jgi:hypothetical protein
LDYVQIHVNDQTRTETYANAKAKMKDLGSTRFMLAACCTDKWHNNAGIDMLRASVNSSTKGRGLHTGLVDMLRKKSLLLSE